MKFNKAQVKGVSIMKEHREISYRVKLPKGRYVIVPSTRNVGDYGSFTLSLYFSQNIFLVETKCLDNDEIEPIPIKEEVENSQNVPEWKVDLVQKRLKYMIADEDEDFSYLNTSQSKDASPGRFK